MQFSLHLTPKDLHIAKAVEQHIHDKAAKLPMFYQRILKCRVVLEGPVRHHRKGGPYRVRIDMGVPGAELLVNRHEHHDVRVAVRDAFEAAQRRLEDYAQCQRGDVKTHDASHRTPSEADAATFETAS